MSLPEKMYGPKSGVFDPCDFLFWVLGRSSKFELIDSNKEDYHPQEPFPFGHQRVQSGILRTQSSSNLSPIAHTDRKSDIPNDKEEFSAHRDGPHRPTSEDDDAKMINAAIIEFAVGLMDAANTLAIYKRRSSRKAVAFRRTKRVLENITLADCLTSMADPQSIFERLTQKVPRTARVFRFMDRMNIEALKRLRSQSARTLVTRRRMPSRQKKVQGRKTFAAVQRLEACRKNLSRSAKRHVAEMTDCPQPSEEYDKEPTRSSSPDDSDDEFFDCSTTLTDEHNQVSLHVLQEKVNLQKNMLQLSITIIRNQDELITLLDGKVDLKQRRVDLQQSTIKVLQSSLTNQDVSLPISSQRAAKEAKVELLERPQQTLKELEELSALIDEQSELLENLRLAAAANTEELYETTGLGKKQDGVSELQEPADRAEDFQDLHALAHAHIELRQDLQESDARILHRQKEMIASIQRLLNE
ncbi:hypothetical protein LTR64_000055 [Lithohypha guttulata]|uniref:uncharacterized protein n=1 Tax=Lithohypha guttulata TaxID=1690604 RepID=UPI002DDFBE3F|nr:hypothetical protein LTR51_007417 [Lithohypha guttulata]